MTMRGGSRINRRSYGVLAAFLALVAASAGLWGLPAWVLGLYGLTSLATAAVYAVDKSAARAGRRRVPESTLLTLGLLGGWPGAIVAQEVLRHKTSKVSFRARFWLTVAVNVAAFALLATPLGRRVRGA